ncbi:MAG: tRNA 5-methoxyuridine(34)/uridine 5-oxyacetic acid(34) synthase CmoB [Epsilonproteobacteria bacterium]|nr:tRNA 5-methoxyuridine(34)/uridine 5-oxyacetic acid(34) synthase CmoB [Campylobacterota bacterium]NPA57100.1 tRNA 5-methoxyuridine(34)/uridine 5-oxyacetic acid(34) synthase CmoB [Campylobacterota bacterium]
MDIAALRRERERWLEWKNIAPLRRLLETLPSVEAELVIGDVVQIVGEMGEEGERRIWETAWAMRPWRKGPFQLFGTFIDSEWRSFIKYRILSPFLDLEGKRVADVGCNNGYYMFRFLEQRPERVVGFDPSPLFKTQFDLINFYARTDLHYELLGVEHLPFYGELFDTIFCLGVIYHRSDPVATLKGLRKALKRGGELFLDSLYIPGEEPIALCPGESYSKISNIHFVPTIAALENWAKKAGFSHVQVLATRETDSSEQRRTEWITGESLEDFLDPEDPTKTVEGYPAPRRVYLRLKER